MPALAVEQAMLEREHAEALHREIDSLPRVFRVPLVLCYFEGLTLDEAAHRLRWPAGTLRSRLARARQKLRRGLTRRGFEPSTITLAAVRSPRSTSPSVSPLLVDTATRAGIRFAAGHFDDGALSAPALVLARQVLSRMLWHKLKLTALSLLFLGVVASSFGWLTRTLAMGHEPIRVPATTQPPVAARAEGVASRPDPGRMTVGGRVLDPQGKPLPNASVMVYGASKQGGDIVRSGSSAPAALGEAKCDGSGNFRLEMPWISSATHHVVGAAALAPGYGVGWVDLDVDAELPAAEITLQPEQVVKALVTTPDGQPVANAWMFSRLLLRPQPWATRGFWGEFHGDVRNGHGELHGLPPDDEIPVYFLDSKNRLGAIADFSVKAAADGPIPVRLAPCGLAMARLVDAKGIPLAGYRDPYFISMIVTPGRDGRSQEAADQDLLAADGDYVSRIAPDHYNDLVSDVQGRFTFPALIPGATYRVYDTTTQDGPGGRKTRKLFVARAGEAVELGDIVIEKPE